MTMVQRKKTATVQFKLRMKETLRARIEKTAKAGKVSMNTEILERLERSFEAETRLGGPGLIEMIENMAYVMRAAGQMAGYYETSELVKRGRWMRIPFAFDQAAQAASAVIEIYRPPGEIVVPERTYAEVTGLGEPKDDPKEAAQMRERFANLGKMFAAQLTQNREEKK